jgi:pyruvate carboxylase
MRVNRLQASACMPLHLDVHKVAGKGVLTGEAVGAAATDNVDGGNGVELEEATPSLAP